jgi:hypothetical protein
MLIQHDDIWNTIDSVDILCITTNLCTNSKGEAIMGRGIAAEAKARYPDCAQVLGTLLLQGNNQPCKIAQDGRTEIWSFPTKNKISPYEELLPRYKNKNTQGTFPGWMGKSSLERIALSASQLRTTTKNKIVALPKPGCGNGGLNWEDVKQVLDRILPEDRFLIFG